MNRAHKVFFVGFAGGFVALAGACSDDTGTSSGGSTSSSGGTTSSGASGTTSSGGTSGSSGTFSTCKSSGSSNTNCAGKEAEVKTYNDCILTKCDSAYKECYGPDYQKGTYAGACGETITCYQKCDCTDFTCLGACKPSEACGTCSQKISACSKECTAPACLTQQPDAGGGGDGGGGGQACTELAACCPTLSGQEKSTCEQIVAAGQGCGGVLNAFKGQGKCT